MSKEVADAISDAFNTEYGTLIDAIVDSFQRGGENCDKNLVGVVDDLAYRVTQIAAAITPQDAVPGKDATGGTVASLTEAIMGVTGGLVKIADAIQALAEAVNQNRHNGGDQRARAVASTKVKTVDRGLRLHPIVLFDYSGIVVKLHRFLRLCWRLDSATVRNETNQRQHQRTQSCSEVSKSESR